MSRTARNKQDMGTETLRAKGSAGEILAERAFIGAAVILSAVCEILDMVTKYLYDWDRRKKEV